MGHADPARARRPRRLAPEGWAIDEATTLIYDGERTRVEGLGVAYHVAGDLRLRIERAT